MRQNAYYRNLKWTFEDLFPCYCYAIKTKSTTIALASFATCLCWQRSELRNCTKRVGASRSQLCPDGPRVHLSGPAYMPSCIRPEHGRLKEGQGGKAPVDVEIIGKKRLFFQFQEVKTKFHHFRPPPGKNFGKNPRLAPHWKKSFRRPWSRSQTSTWST